MVDFYESRIDIRIIESPSNLSRATLLERTYPSYVPEVPLWRDWFAAAAAEPNHDQKTIKFGSHTEQIYDAALNNVGVFLGGIGVSSMLMASGRLICPFGPLLPQRTGVKLVWQSSVKPFSAAAKFRDRLLDQLRDVIEYNHSTFFVNPAAGHLMR